MDYQNYIKKVAKWVKQNFDLDIDTKNTEVLTYIEQGYRLASFPYYVGMQIVKNVYPE